MNYTEVDGKVVSEDGRIAVQHRTSNGAVVRAGNTNYVFSPQHNVSLAWVAPEHLSKVLSEVARVCCGKSGKKFFLASMINVNIWYTGDRYYQGN